MPDSPDSPPDDDEEVTALLEPPGGVSAPLTKPEQITDLARRLAAAEGPVAIDAERASGYRYSPRAQLIQLHRRGVGTVLIDPIEVPDLSSIGEALRGAEWVIHAASQDLACLADTGMRPDRLFDTELGGRIAGLERVSLGRMTELLLKISLAKGHSAADWSIRPLPRDYLVYAALDVEILLDLRDAVESLLDEQGKLGWAHEEFEGARTAPPSSPRVNPWRRTNGIQAVKDRAGLAIVRALWESRDEIAQRTDLAPGKMLPDRLIVAAAVAKPTHLGALLDLDGFTRRGVITHRKRWIEAIRAAQELPESELPPRREPVDPSAPPSRWMSKEPKVAEFFAVAREVVLAISEELSIPAENIVPPSAIRALAWQHPERLDAESVDAFLAAEGARPWQRALVSERLAAALSAD